MKTPGQIAYEAWANHPPKSLATKWEYCPQQSAWEAAAQAVLPSQWRSVDDPPENDLESIVLFGGNDDPRVSIFRGRHKARTHWMPIPALPEKTEEQKSRAEFEKHWDDLPSSSIDGKSMAFIHWEAGRKSKEGEKP